MHIIRYDTICIETRPVNPICIAVTYSYKYCRICHKYMAISLGVFVLIHPRCIKTSFTRIKIMSDSILLIHMLSFYKTVFLCFTTANKQTSILFENCFSINIICINQATAAELNLSPSQNRYTVASH